MNRTNHTPRLAAAALTLAAVGGAALIAGPLTPPAGPVAPTYKTLAEIEPRTPVGPATPGDINSNFRITQPGSYYLTGNILAAGKTGITIDASGVTLDLSGFEIYDAAPASGQSRYGVRIGLGQVGVCIKNGSIRNTNLDGIRDQGLGSRFENLSLTDCGRDGIYTEHPATLVNCTAVGCTEDGFQLSGASVERCTAEGNGGRGFFNTNSGAMSGCVARANTSYGFELLGGVARGCTGNNNVYGFYAGGAQVLDCTASGNNSGAIRVNSGCIVRGCSAEAPAAFPCILVSGTHNRIEGNKTHNGSAGVQVSGGGHTNLIIGNSFFQAGTPFVGTLSSNIVGPMITATGTITSTNPHANFAY